MYSCHRHRRHRRRRRRHAMVVIVTVVAGVIVSVIRSGSQCLAVVWQVVMQTDRSRRPYE